MAEAGERETGGKPSHGATVIKPTLTDLGFPRRRQRQGKRVSALKSKLPAADPGDLVVHRWRERANGMPHMAIKNRRRTALRRSWRTWPANCLARREANQANAQRPWLLMGGRLLKAMAEAGERANRGRQTSHGETFATLADLGFSRSRASRWQIAAELPDDLREAYDMREAFLAGDEGDVSAGRSSRRTQKEKRPPPSGNGSGRRTSALCSPALRFARRKRKLGMRAPVAVTPPPTDRRHDHSARPAPVSPAPAAPRAHVGHSTASARAPPSQA